MDRRRTLTCATSATAVLALAVTGQLGASAARASVAAPAAGPVQKVIVVLRDQLPGTPVTKGDMRTRIVRTAATQSAVLTRLTGPKPTAVRHFAVGNAFTATVSSAQEAELNRDPAVASVVVDARIAVNGTAAPGAPTTAAAPLARTAVTNATGVRGVATSGPFVICPANPAHPRLEPEALKVMRALTDDGSPNAQQLATGAGVKVAFIADGINPNNPDLIRANGQHVIVDYQDFSGEGPSTSTSGIESLGDASSLAAQGRVSYDLSTFVNPAYALPAGCTIRIVGVAPGASIVALKAGGTHLTTSAILQSIDYAVSTSHVDVINESFGGNAYPDNSSRSAVLLFNRQAVAAGVTVTVSSGDAGVTGTIGREATDPAVISVGGTTTGRSSIQSGSGASVFSNGHWLNDNIATLSSSGFSEYGRTIDLVAPADSNWAVCDASFPDCLDDSAAGSPTNLQMFGGTSESAPLTAGAAALVIQAFRSTHQGASPSPATVKAILTGTAKDLALPADEQGSGLVDARAAVEAALTYPGATAPTRADVASHIVTSPGQTTLVGAPGTQQIAHVHVTNVGTQTQTVSATTRAFPAAGPDDTELSIPFNANTLPTFTDLFGGTRAFKKFTFTVAPGTDRLRTRMAYPGVAPQILYLTLLQPDGTFAGYSSPQGPGVPANYANIDIRRPVAGRWTGILTSRVGTGFVGTALVGIASQRAHPLGQVTPSTFVLAPGQTRTVAYSVPMPAGNSVDVDSSLVFSTASGQRSAVSVVRRTLLDLSPGHAIFGGRITGGNARPSAPAQTFGYEFDVPRGKRDLDVALQLRRSRNIIVETVLIDPNGEVADVASNLSVNEAGTLLTQVLGIQMYDANPIPGRWHLVVVAQNPVSGQMLEQPFAGSIGFDQVLVSAAGLPTSANTVLKNGQPVTVDIRVKNSGGVSNHGAAANIVVGLDPRLEAPATFTPYDFGLTRVDLPSDGSQTPFYVVPPNTEALTVSAHSTLPAQLTLYSTGGGIEVAGDLGSAQAGKTTSTARVSESNGYIGTGLWFTDIGEIGPFNDSGATAGTSTVTATMRALGFDHTVTSSTGDPFQIAYDGAADGFGTPVLIRPGHTRVIHATITPHGKKGDVVNGRLNVVIPPALPSGFTAQPYYSTGSVVQALSYSYTIG
jgi:hypothetical protein